MNPGLTYIVAQERVAELRNAGQRERLAAGAASQRRDSRRWNPITRLGAQLAHLTAPLAPSRP